jgi:uncharacterized protein
MYRLLTILVCLILLSDLVKAQAENTYLKEIAGWDTKRVQNLKADNGWLNLAGLYWLNEGKNSFGSSKKNNVVFPEGTIEPEVGYLERSGYTIKLVVTTPTEIKMNGKPVKEALIFHKDSVNNPILSHGNLQWNIIKQQEKIGLRLRNLKSDELVNFKGIERFPVDTAWRITATLLADTVPVTISITTILGQIVQEKTPGKLAFSINNKQYTLIALEEDDALFILFADATNGDETYASGRFLYVKKPGADGKTIIDFNKAYNPPCAFTPYATCPLPPKQNNLPIAIPAGEKKYGQH